GGALITARQACDDHGRSVFALPGRVDQSTSAGPDRLIREGAVLTSGIDDILQNLGPLPQAAMEPIGSESFDGEGAESAKPQAEGAPAVMIDLTDRQRLIVSHLTVDPIHVDALIERTELRAQDVLQDLTLLSLNGIGRRID